MKNNIGIVFLILFFSLCLIPILRQGSTEEGVSSVENFKSLPLENRQDPNSILTSSEAQRIVLQSRKQRELDSQSSFSLVQSEKDFEKMLSFIRNRFGDGIEKDVKIGELFRSADLPLDVLFGLAAKLSSEREKRRANLGIRMRFQLLTSGEIATKVDFEKLNNFPNAIDTLSKGFESYVNSALPSEVRGRMEEVVSFLIGSTSFSLLKTEERSSLLVSLSRSLHFREFWHIMDRIAPEYLSEPQFQRSLFKKFKGENAFEALSQVGTFRDLDSQAAFALAAEAVRHNPVRAKQFFKDLDVSIQAASWFEASFVRHELENGDFEQAIEFVEKTDDENLKKDIGWHLWKMQKELIVKEIFVEPEKTVSAFIDGTTGYQDYMLEAAVTHWIEREPNKAADWAEENIKEMAHGPRQYVAASYAKEAAAQGDMTLARQWANLIQDEKTLTRINGILEKAEQADSN